jgi:SagB-type dehydrogenase family enzyme
MTTALVLSFRAGVALVEPADEPARLQMPRGQLRLDGLPAGVLAALRTLGQGGATQDALADQVLASDEPADVARLYYLLPRLSRLCLLTYSLLVDQEPLATVLPMADGFEPTFEPVAPDTPYRLSRFAYCRRDGDALTLESPCARARTLLPGHRGAALAGALARPSTAAALSRCFPWLADDTARTFLGLLASVEAVAAVDDDDRLAEDANVALRQWEFHDLLFHSRTRMGRHDYPFGATYRFLDELPPLPAVPPRPAGAVVPLCRPDLTRLADDDVPFTRVLESRRSVRTFGAEPITAEQLGQFLYRVARVRALHEADRERGALYAVTSRPYPSGGATYDLELYITVNRCRGLPDGLYYYAPLEHQLTPVSGRTEQVERLLRDAQAAAGLATPPPVLITVASRFQRLSWKYAGMAYATTLKNVGVLYQTMYLVATAMGLAACALGAGDADLFAAAAGTDYYAESSVGEFLLGSLPAVES